MRDAFIHMQVSCRSGILTMLFRVAKDGRVHLDEVHTHKTSHMFPDKGVKNDLEGWVKTLAVSVKRGEVCHVHWRVCADHDKHGQQMTFKAKEELPEWIDEWAEDQIKGII